MISYHLKRNSVTADLVFGLGIGLLGLVTLVYFSAHLKGGKALLGAAVALPVLLFLNFKRFLSELAFDFNTKTIKTTSVIPFIKREYNFSRLKAVQIIPINRIMLASTAFKPQNLALRFEGNIQPFIYEIKNREDFAIAEKMVQEFTKGFPVEII